jgi:hypothetical protein
MTDPLTQKRRGMVSRMAGAAFLDIETFEEIEHDRGATGQAAAVVVVMAVCQAIGGSGAGLLAGLGAGLLALGSWAVFAGIAFLVGQEIFEGEATWGEVLRTLGFAQAPGVLYLLDVIPVFGFFLSLFVSIWVLVASFIGIRQALDIGNGKTFLTILVSGGVYTFLQTFLFLPF